MIVKNFFSELYETKDFPEEPITFNKFSSKEITERILYSFKVNMNIDKYMVIELLYIEHTSEDDRYFGEYIIRSNFFSSIDEKIAPRVIRRFSSYTNLKVMEYAYLKYIYDLIETILDAFDDDIEDMIDSNTLQFKDKQSFYNEVNPIYFNLY